MHSAITKVLITTALTLGMSQSTHAATLYTPVLEAGTLTDGVTCRALNVGTKEKVVTIEIFNDDGELVRSKTATLSPGQGTLLDDESAVFLSTGRYCRITAPGKAGQIRGVLYVRTAEANPLGESNPLSAVAAQ